MKKVIWCGVGGRWSVTKEIESPWQLAAVPVSCNEGRRQAQQEEPPQASEERRT